jgi:hypothetical protein
VAILEYLARKSFAMKFCAAWMPRLATMFFEINISCLDACVIFVGRKEIIRLMRVSLELRDIR